MIIHEMSVTIKWHIPSDGDLPTKYDKYYVVDNNDEHKIMTFHPDGGWGGMNWEGDWGSNSMKSNEEILKWTNLLI